MFNKIKFIKKYLFLTNILLLIGGSIQQLVKPASTIKNVGLSNDQNSLQPDNNALIVSIFYLFVFNFFNKV
jgi:hypothetical protein